MINATRFAPRRAVHGAWVVTFGLSIVAWVDSTRAPPAFFLDADTIATGSQLGSQPLNSPLGTITFNGSIENVRSDAEFNAAGATGNAFDIGANSTALMTFNFDVQSISFIYGGNFGVLDAEARDIHGVAVDAFFQADTYIGQPAGPITLMGTGIRSLFWRDPGNTFSAIDNVTITQQVPEAGTALLAALGFLVAAVGASRRR